MNSTKQGYFSGLFFGKREYVGTFDDRIGDLIGSQ